MTVTAHLYGAVMATPLGELLIEADAEAIRRIEFCDVRSPQPFTINALVAAAQQQLKDYFAGQLRQFALPLAPQGTAFQAAAWQALQQIPYGETRSYSAQAQAIGRPRAVRAIGAANGANPIAIVIPCHRVIGKSGQLTGYAGGLDRKQWLLAFEQHGHAG